MDSTWRPDPAEPLRDDEVKGWKQKAQQHLDRLHGGEAEASKSIGTKTRKVERIPAYRHQVGLDNVIQCVLGEGRGFSLFLPGGVGPGAH